MIVTLEIVTLFDAACRVQLPQDADLFTNLVALERLKTERESLDAARDWARQAICYWAGYFSHEVRLRVEELYGCVHPIFGSATQGRMTAERAYEIGRNTLYPEYPWPMRPPPYAPEP